MAAGQQLPPESSFNAYFQRFLTGFSGVQRRSGNVPTCRSGETPNGTGLHKVLSDSSEGVVLEQPAPKVQNETGFIMVLTSFNGTRRFPENVK